MPASPGWPGDGNRDDVAAMPASLVARRRIALSGAKPRGLGNANGAGLRTDELGRFAEIAGHRAAYPVDSGVRRLRRAGICISLSPTCVRAAERERGPTA